MTGPDDKKSIGLVRVRVWGFRLGVRRTRAKNKVSMCTCMDDYA